MRVKYNDFSSVVPDDSNPAQVFNVLKDTFTELQNGSYNIETENGEKVMKVFLRTGSKASL